MPQREPSVFMAAMSFLVYLDPQNAISLLEERAALLGHEVLGLSTTIDALVKRIARINLIETEYMLAMRRAEIEWIRRLILDLQSGEFTWNLQEIIEEIRATKRASLSANSVT